MSRLYLLRDQYGQLCMIQFYLFAEKLDLVHVLYKKQQSIKQLWGLWRGIGITVIPVSANKLYKTEVVYKELYDSNFVAEMSVAYKNE